MPIVLIVAVIVAAGKAIGFLREAVIARTFGVSSGFSAYVYAGAIPFAVATMIAYALNWLLLPEYQEVKRRSGTEAANARLYGRVLAPLLASLLGVGVMLSPPLQAFLVDRMPHAYDPSLVVRLVVLLSLSIPLQIVASTLTTQALSSERQVLVASQPIVQSLVILAGLALARSDDPTSLAVLYLLGQVAYIGVAFAVLRMEGLAYRGSIPREYGFPIGLGVSILAIEALPQAASAIDRVVVGEILDGSNFLAQLAYAQNLTGFGVAIGVALVLQLWFPRMLRQDEGGRARLKELVHVHSMPVGLIVIAFLWLASRDLVHLAFVGGRFDAQSASQVGWIFRIISPTIVFDLSYSIAMAGAIASQQHVRVMASNVILVLVKALFIGLLLVHRDPALFAAGLVAASLIRYVMLVVLLRRGDGFHPWPQRTRMVFAVNLAAGIVATIAMVAAISSMGSTGTAWAIGRAMQLPIWLSAYVWMARVIARCRYS